MNHKYALGFIWIFLQILNFDGFLGKNRFLKKMKNLWKSSNENQRNDKEEDCVKRGTSAGWDLRQRMWGAVAKNMSFFLYKAHMWLAVTDETQLQ